jgi:carbonic anhydrase/acetyltransferase-like protein (isoleucine patch superfamily)
MGEMMRFRPEQVALSAWIAPGAVVLGDVSIGELSSIWFNAVVRGDTEAISIGRQTNVQDGAVLHADENFPCRLGDRVTVGHNAVVHGCTLEDGVLVGMGSVVMNGAEIGKDSLIGVGAVVTAGTVIPPGSLVLGLPGKVIRPLSAEERLRSALAADHYVKSSRKFIETGEAGRSASS